jgi:RNA polymerase sigma-70 factor (ECF subfamily)
MHSAPRRTRDIEASIVEPVTDGHERDLLSRIAARDREAMRDFYFIYHRRLARFIARITARRELVDDTVNEAFGTVWQRAAEFRGDSRVSTWVMGIVWQGLTSIRRERRFAPRPRLSKIPPAVETKSHEGWNAWERAMSTLSAEHRALIELAYFGAYSCEEIGAIMKYPAHAVRTRLLQARSKLRAGLEAGALADATAGRATPGADLMSPSAHGA